MLMKWLSLVLVPVVLAACGGSQPSDSGPAVNLTPQLNAQLSHPAGSLLGSITDVSLKKVETKDRGAFVALELRMNLAGKETLLTFESGRIDEKYSQFGTYFNGDLVANASYSTDTAPVRASFRCASSDCTSVVAAVAGNTKFIGEKAVIEHQEISGLLQRSVGEYAPQQESTKAFLKALLGLRMNAEGSIEITRVRKTNLQKVFVYSLISPDYNNEVFESALRVGPKTDLTQLPQYFERRVGVVAQLTPKGTEQKFFWSNHPNTGADTSGGGSAKVSVEWRPAAGQLSVVVEENKGGGRVEIGYESERLVKPALDDEGSQRQGLFQAVPATSASL